MFLDGFWVGLTAGPGGVRTMVRRQGSGVRGQGSERTLVGVCDLLPYAKFAKDEPPTFCVKSRMRHPPNPTRGLTSRHPPAHRKKRDERGTASHRSSLFFKVDDRATCPRIARHQVPTADLVAGGSIACVAGCGHVGAAARAGIGPALAGAVAEGAARHGSILARPQS